MAKKCVGDVVGDVVGEMVGDVVGDVVGAMVGDVVGEVVGEMEGEMVGLDLVGELVGLDVVGDTVGEVVGEDIVGETVGDTVGETVGDVVDDTEFGLITHWESHCQNSIWRLPHVTVWGVPSVHEVHIDEIAVPTTQLDLSKHTSGFWARFLQNTNTGAPKLEYVSLIVFYLTPFWYSIVHVMRASTTNPQTAQPPSTLKPWRVHSKRQ